jgi:hypothetical protein
MKEGTGPVTDVRFTAALQRTDGELWQFFIPAEAAVVSGVRSVAEGRVICTVNGAERFHAALLPDGNGDFIILLNKDRRKRLGADAGDTMQVHLIPDLSEYGLPMSDELREVLAQYPEADRLFHALTPGKMRTLIHWAGNVKNPDIRVRRSIVMAEHLIGLEGKIDFKVLNEQLKEANRLAGRG